MTALNKLTDPDKPLGGRYKIISQLGEGGFGQTFLAEDLHLPDHPICVVKQLKPQVSDPDSLQAARRLFDMEARVLYQLGDHDQIPRLLAHFEENEEFYLAQELVEGEPLSRELIEGSPWLEVQVIPLLQDILHVLAFVHQQNVIHRDIKPSNLIRRKHDGRIVLIDFGAVKQASTQVVNRQTEQTKTISIGTQGYTPKEQLGGNPRYSSDVYAVGIVGIQALTGIHPKRLTEDPETGEIEWRNYAQVSPELAEVLDWMVRYDFRTRYPTAVEALEALRSLPTFTESMAAAQLSFEAREGLPQESRSPFTASKLTGSGVDSSPTKPWQPPQPPVQPSSNTVPIESGTGSLPTKPWEPTQPIVQSQSNPSNTGSQQLLATPHSSAVTPTGSGINSSPTKPWEPTQPIVQSQSNPSNTGSQELLATPDSAAISPPRSTRRSRQRRRFGVLLPVLAVLLAGGATLLLAKTGLSPQLTSQTTDRSSLPVDSPTASPSEKPASPSPASSSAASPTTSPSEKPAPSSPASPVAKSPTVTPSEEKPVPPSPTSPVVKSPTASSTKKSPPPAPKNPPTTTQAPPAPVPPVTKPVPAANEPSVADLLSQADRLREAGQYQKAIAAYDIVIAKKPDVAQAYWGKCYSLNSIQQPDDAIAACNKALDLNSNYPEALWSKGNALDQEQRFSDSLKLYQQAIALKPDFAEAWNNMGVALLKLDRPAEAVDAFDRATSLKPDFANAWANRGAAFWQLGRLRLAIASLDKALQIQPDNQDAINLRQQAREKLGR